MTQLSITNVVQVSVSQANTGLNAYNTSNLAVSTAEPTTQAVQTIEFSGISASGAFVLTFAGVATASIAYNATLATIQSVINAVTGMSKVSVSGSISSQTLTLTQRGDLGPIPLASVTTNTLQTAGSVDVDITPTTTSIGFSGGTLGYALYTSPTEVADDFGTDSVTYQQANAVFSQQPNILAGNGQFIAILRRVTQQTLTFSGVPASGAFTIRYDGNTTSSLAYNASPATILAALRALPGLEQVQLEGSLPGQLLRIIFTGVYGPAALVTNPANTLATSAPANITITVAAAVAGDTYGDAITNSQGLVNYFGIIPNETLDVIGEDDMLDAAAVIQALNVIGFFVSFESADIQPGGALDLLRTGTFTQSRGLYYGDDDDDGINAALMMAAYAGRGLSVNFNGSNTTITMHLKQLSGIQPDPSMTQTLLSLAQAAGADVYASIQGNSAIFSSGENKFFDQVYNLRWFVGAIQVALYNTLAASSTKIPQTEDGMDVLKGSCRTVCDQSVSNQYVAPGRWTSPDTFGNQDLFLKNISQYGYYIYSSPIASQLQTARAARQAPLIQIALKEAGAIQEADVIIYVNE